MRCAREPPGPAPFDRPRLPGFRLESPPMASRRRSLRTVGPVERLRSICLALPETAEKVAWGEPTWRVRGRLFAQLDDHSSRRRPSRGLVARAARRAGVADLP